MEITQQKRADDGAEDPQGMAKNDANPLESFVIQTRKIPCDGCGDVHPCAPVGPRWVCGPCLERALFALAATPAAQLRLYEFQGLLCVAREACDRLRREIQIAYTAQFQRELWQARDPDLAQGGLHEGERMQVALTLSRYTHDRVQALADEVGVSVPAWIRQAIAFAFQKTTHRLDR